MKRTLAFIMLFVYVPAYAQIGRGVVTGQIRAVDGRPAAGLRVAAMEIPDQNRAAAATSLLASITETGSDGKYRLEDLPPGRYYIVAGKLDAPTYYPGSRTAANAKAISVTAGVTTAGIDFAATAPLRVTGRVIGLEAPAPAAPGAGTLFALNPVANSGSRRIVLNPVRPPNAGTSASPLAISSVNLMIAPLGEDGSFEFRDVPSGDYTIGLLGMGQDFIIRSASAMPAQVPTIVVSERDVTDVIVAFPTHVTGSVVVDQDGPAPSFLLTFTDSTAPPIRVSASTAHPIAVALPRGQYRVDVSGLADGYSVQSIDYGLTGVLHAPLTITDTSNLDNLLVVRLGVSSPPPWGSIKLLRTKWEYRCRKPIPRLGEGGVAAATEKRPRSFGAADGAVR